MNPLAAIPTWLHNRASDTYLPLWFAQLRETHWQAFLQHGLPTKQQERWKYTDLSFLAKLDFIAAKRMDPARFEETVNQHRLQNGESVLLVSVNGYFMPTLSDMHKLPPDVIACNMSEALNAHSDLFKQHWPQDLHAKDYPFVNLNAAMCEDGIFFYLPDQCEIDKPIHLLSLVADTDEFIAHPRHLFILGKQSKLVLAEEHFSLVDHAYMMNIATTINVGQQASLDYYKIQQEGKRALHMAHMLIRQMQDSHVSLMHFSAGGEFARDDISVQLVEPGAHCNTQGLYHTYADHQTIYYHIDINHAASHSHSKMIYKGILDQKSRTIFNGRVYVAKDAQKITAYQANHNLVLSNNAEVYSKPELEIYADDVKCKHGATIGQLDQAAIFYLRARGISESEAVQMLLQGYSEEILQQVTQVGIKMRVQGMFQC